MVQRCLVLFGVLFHGFQSAVTFHGKLPHPSPYLTSSTCIYASNCCHVVLVCTQQLGMSNTGGALTQWTAWPGEGPKTLQPSALFYKEQGGGHQVPSPGVGTPHCLPHT